MLINYLLVAFRNIRRHLGYTVINVSGLALGVASCLLIFLVVRYELGYDAFYAKADRIYRVNHHSIDYNPRTSPAVITFSRSTFAVVGTAHGVPLPIIIRSSMSPISTPRSRPSASAASASLAPRWAVLSR